MSGSRHNNQNTYYRSRLYIEYLLCNQSLKEFNNAIKISQKSPASNIDKRILKEASTIVKSENYKTVFDSDFNQKLKHDQTYLNLFYCLYSLQTDSSKTEIVSKRKQVLFIPSNKINIVNFYWYKCFLAICSLHNFQIIAVPQWKWTNVLKACKFLWSNLSVIEVRCQTKLKLRNCANSLYDLKYLFPCFDKKCFNNKLFRMILLADIVIIERGVSQAKRQFILDICSDNNKSLFYKTYYSFYIPFKQKKHTFFQKNGIKKITLLSFFKLKWSY